MAVEKLPADEFVCPAEPDPGQLRTEYDLFAWQTRTATAGEECRVMLGNIGKKLDERGLIDHGAGFMPELKARDEEAVKPPEPPPPEKKRGWNEKPQRSAWAATQLRAELASRRDAP